MNFNASAGKVTLDKQIESSTAELRNIEAMFNMFQDRDNHINCENIKVLATTTYAVPCTGNYAKFRRICTN